MDLLILRTLAQRHPGKSVGRTYSSILQDNGEDVKVVQELLRNSSSKMTLDVCAQALTPTKRAGPRNGRLETTALAVEALAKLKALGDNSTLAEQVNRGLQYLLTHKDRYACWYSTQATQNVIEAIIAAMPAGRNGTGDDTASVLVNGTKLTDIKLPQAAEVVGPRVIDFGKELKAGTNRFALERAGENSAMETNVITSYSVPWPQAEATQTENFKSGDARALKLKVQFDRREEKVGEALACRVEAERIGFAGYGMMIAEIGLPPGVEVDRESLEAAKQSGVYSYEVQPVAGELILRRERPDSQNARQ